MHRARLFAQHLPSYGWTPVILTVHEKFYEESLDHNLVKLLPNDLRIEKVKAFKRLGLIGDIGIRAFFQLEMILNNSSDSFSQLNLFCANK